MKTLPVLEAPNRADLLKPHSAIRMIMGAGQSGYSVVLSNQDVPPSGKEYVTRYQKARLAVKNHPVKTEEGNVEPLSPGSLPNDAGQYLGQRLPDEMLHYMSKGLIDPRILQWRTTCEVFEVPPMDGGESSEYRNLVSNKIIPLRTLVVNLLSSTLNKWYGHNDLKQTNWFSSADPKQKATIHVERPSEAQTPSIVNTWNVKEATFKDAVAQHKVSDPTTCYALNANTDNRSADLSDLPFYHYRTPILSQRRSLRRILRTSFPPPLRSCTTRYGGSLLYESTWTQATT
jgi:hypothetical protein